MFLLRCILPRGASQGGSQKEQVLVDIFNETHHPLPSMPSCQPPRQGERKHWPAKPCSYGYYSLVNLPPFRNLISRHSIPDARTGLEPSQFCIISIRIRTVMGFIRNQLLDSYPYVCMYMYTSDLFASAITPTAVVGDDDLVSYVTADADAQGMYALYSTNLGSR